MKRFPAPSRSLLVLAAFLAAAAWPASAVPLDCFGFAREVRADLATAEGGAVYWSSSGCAGEVVLRGRVSFNSGFLPLAMEPGSRIEVEERAEGETRRMVVLPGSARGRVRVGLRVDGESAAFDDEARAWLGERLALFVRQTGYRAAERVAALRGRGLGAVLAEVESLDNDRVERLYLERLLEGGGLGGDGRREVLSTAARTIESDGELAGFLTGIVRAPGFDDAAAAATVGSDGDLARVVAAGLAAPGIGPAGRTALLGAARGVAGDGDAAGLLVGAAPRLDLDAAAERAAVDVVLAGIASDADLARALAALAARDDLGRQGLALVLAAARRGVASDGDLAQLLVEVARRHRLDGDLAEAYRAAAATLGSDEDRSRALAAL